MTKDAQLTRQPNDRTAQERYLGRIQAQLDLAAQRARVLCDNAARSQAEARALWAEALNTRGDSTEERAALFSQAQAASDLARVTRERADDAERVVCALMDQLITKQERGRDGHTGKSADEVYR